MARVLTLAPSPFNERAIGRFHCATDRGAGVTAVELDGQMGEERGVFCVCAVMVK